MENIDINLHFGKIKAKFLLIELFAYVENVDYIS